MNRVMTLQIIREHAKAYRQADKVGKGQILDNLVAVLHRSRKSLIRSLNHELGSSDKTLSRRLGRPPKYSAEVEAALSFVWQAYNYPSAERLASEIPEAIRIFRRDGMWSYSDAATAKLLSMSLGSMKLRTSKFSRNRGLMRGFSTTRPSNLLKTIPVFFGDWSTLGAGYGQIDTVVHSGAKLMGVMAYTVNFVDVATYWQEPVAQLNKGEVATKASLETIRSRLPFKLSGLHPDSGSEFINYNLKRWCDELGIELTRSRPNKKNDNCFIEQRNNVVVRKYIGYGRYDCLAAVDVMNELYEVLRLYVNFFQPSFKLVSRGRLPNGKYIRQYDQPITPFKRVLIRREVPALSKQLLQQQYEALNPKVLLAKIEKLTIKLERVQKELGYHY
jgi:transposase InsO family protein